MIALLRIEVYRDGEFIAARTVPNANVAKVFIARQKERGLHAFLTHPRTETERAS
jgi:hypothetical protein